MSASYHSRAADQVNVGDRLPELRVPVTATTIALGASATRDWQPQHHDHAWAVRVGTKDIFMNTPTQAGWISRYITDWAGATARLGRMSFRMRQSIYPGDTMVLNGTVTRVTVDDAGCNWIDVAVEQRVGDSLCTATSVTVALPASVGKDNPWQRGADKWRIADLPRDESATAAVTKVAGAKA